MSTTIDSRVVEMRFDNKHFENNVATSMSTLDKLKQSLKLENASKGLENVSKSAKSIDFSVLSTAAEKVGLKFNAMYTIADQALRNITNSAVNAGKRIASALTIDPIKTGFSEYETQINAVQTILANTKSKGTTLDDVNSALDELNTYADKTIYNFTEMTRNIGTFTAAGVDLDKSVTSIKGIANLAAVSGSSSQQASTAMYQLSQALAAGRVSLMDWNSVVNAGMGGQLFQDALKRTAKNMGHDVDSIIAKYGSFRESLSKGNWLTTEVLTETLTQLSGAYTEADLIAKGYTKSQAKEIVELADTAVQAATKVKTFTQLWDTLKEAAQSGWTQTWEIIVGDFEEAKTLLTNISDVIGKMIGASAEARNELLQGWKDAGGRTMLIEAFSNAFEGIMSVVKPIKEAFREIFPPTTVKQLVGITEGLKNFTSKLILGETTSNNLKRTFKGLFAIIDIVRQAFSAVFKIISPLFGKVDDLGGGILSLTAAFGDWLVNLNNTIKTTDAFSSAFNKVVECVSKFVNMVANGVKQALSVISDKFAAPGLVLLNGLLEKIGFRMTQVGEVATDMKTAVTGSVQSMGTAVEESNLVKFIKSLWNGIKSIASGIGRVFGDIGKGLFNTIANGNFDKLFDLVNTVSFGGIALAITKFVKGISSPFDGLDSIFEGVTNVLDEVGGCLQAWQTQLKAGALLKIAGAIGILAASILLISTIDSEKLTESLAAITILFGDLMGSMAIFTKISGNSGKMAKGIAAMMSISIAVLIMSSALKKVSSIDSDKLAGGIIGITALTALIVGTAKILGSGKNNAMKGATQMVVFALAIKILAGVCADLGSISFGDMTKGLVGVGILLAEVSLFMKTAKFSGKAISTATGIVIISSAIKILASACKDFGQMSWGEISKGLTSIAALMLELAAFIKLTGNAKNVILTGIALIAIGAAMKILASACKDFGQLSWGEIGKGLVGIAGALLSIALAMKLMPKNMINASLSLIAIGAAMKILASAMTDISHIGWDGVGKGLVGIAGSLLSIALAMKLMPKNMIGASIGLIGISTAMVILANALSQMGGMSWESVAKGLVALGGAMAILAIGLNLMKHTLAGSAALLVASTAILVLTPALKALGSMSWESIAKGLVSIAGAFVILGVAGAVLGGLTPAILGLSTAFMLVGVGALAIGAGFVLAGAGITSLATGIAALAAALATGTVVIADAVIDIIVAVGVGLIELCKVIADGAPVISEAVVALVVMLADVLVRCVPVIARSLLSLVDGILVALVDFTPKIVDSLFNFVISLIDGLARNIPKIIQAVVNVLMSVFSGVVDALGSVDISTLVKGIAGIGIIATVVAALASIAVMIPAAMAGAVGAGVVVLELAAILAAIGSLTEAFPDAESKIDSAASLLESIGKAIGSFVGGIVGGVISGVTSVFPQIGSDLSSFMTNAEPFINGAKNIDASVLNGIMNLSGAILTLTATKLIEGIASFITGGSPIVKFGKELSKFGTYFKEYADSIKGINSDVVTASSNAAMSLANMASKLPNQGGIASWFEGENRLSKFGKELSEFGPHFKKYADSVKGINPDVVTASADAANSLGEMASKLPNQGGVVSWFEGDNKISKFGEELAEFGPHFKKYSDSVKGINPDVVISSANAANSLGEMAAKLPNQGGIVSWFTGDNSVSKFGEELAKFGPHFKSYSDSIKTINPTVVTASANAASSLANLADKLPNKGGVVQWFTGDKSIARFGEELAKFGPHFKTFSDSVRGINSTAVSAAATAGKTLAEMEVKLPKEGGFVDLFTGTSDMADFGKELVGFGNGMAEFSTSVAGKIDSAAVVAAAEAGKALAEMEAKIPETGGFFSLFTGDKSLTPLIEQLKPFGEAMVGFSTVVAGKIDAAAITSAANAGKILAEMEATVPKTGGWFEMFTGVRDWNLFTTNIQTFGDAIVKFSNKISGNIDAEAVTAAGNFASFMSTAYKTIPEIGGFVGGICGDQDWNAFVTGIAKFGEGMQKFNTDTLGIIDADTITKVGQFATTMATAYKTIPEISGFVGGICGDQDWEGFILGIAKLGIAMQNYTTRTLGAIDGDTLTKVGQFAQVLSASYAALPTVGGVVSWFEGDQDWDGFVSGIGKLGTAMKAYTTGVLGEISEETVSSVGKLTSFMAEFYNALPYVGGIASWFKGDKKDAFEDAIDAMDDIADSMQGFANAVATIGSAEDFSKAVDTLGRLGEVLKNAPQNWDNYTLFETAINDFANSGLNAFIKTFVDGQAKVNAAFTQLVLSLILRTKLYKTAMENAFKDLVGAGIKGASQSLITFKFLGIQFAAGLANGISMGTPMVASKARAMAAAAAKAVEDELDINSPSKVGYRSGNYFGLGFVNAIDEYASKAYNSSSEMAEYASKGLSDAISKIRNVVDGDMDVQPTIRPVLDLSDVKSKAAAISNMLGPDSSIGMMANVNGISAMMDRSNQNGSDVVDAINKLRKDLGNVRGNTYNVNGVTYDDGSNVSNAVEMLVRAAKIGRRV